MAAPSGLPPPTCRGLRRSRRPAPRPASSSAPRPTCRPSRPAGKAVDKRADIWAFGVVLFEMLTGRRLFEGETLSDLLAAVLKTAPDFTASPRAFHLASGAFSGAACEKDPKERLHDIADARIELTDEEEAAPAAPSTVRAAAERAAARPLGGGGARDRGRGGVGASARGRPRAEPPRRAEPGGASALRHGVLGAHRPLARRATAGLHGGRRRRPCEGLRAEPRRRGGTGPSRHRGRGRPLLLAGRPVGRLLRGREAEARGPRRAARRASWPTRPSIEAGAGARRTSSSSRRRAAGRSSASRPREEPWRR